MFSQESLLVAEMDAAGVVGIAMLMALEVGYRLLHGRGPGGCCSRAVVIAFAAER